jgi:hypothetical protein
MPPVKYTGRNLTLYFESDQEVKDIHQAAENARVPYAKFCREMIRRGMEQPQKPQNDSLELREELAAARRNNTRLSDRIAQLEAELFAARHSTILGYSSKTVDDSASNELVDLLKSGGSWRSDAIMKALGIDPKNIDAIRALAGHLRALQDLGLVAEGNNGWRWVNGQQ